MALFSNSDKHNDRLNNNHDESKVIIHTLHLSRYLTSLFHPDIIWTTDHYTDLDHGSGNSCIHVFSGVFIRECVERDTLFRD